MLLGFQQPVESEVRCPVLGVGQQIGDTFDPGISPVFKEFVVPRADDEQVRFVAQAFAKEIDQPIARV